MKQLHGWLTVLCVAVIFHAGPAFSEIHVWTMTGTDRVLRAAPPGTALDVSISAARNEWESFQILLRSDEPATVTGIDAGTLNGPDGAALHGSDIRLYREHQFEITDGSYRNDAFVPGWYPDALIPFLHPLTGNPLGPARFSAVPFELPAGQTHGFWIDIPVPDNVPAGLYTGLFRVRFESGETVDIPVSMTVWDFTLPRVLTMVTGLGSPSHRMRGYYRKRAESGFENEPENWEEVENQVAEMLTRHHINATPPDGSIKSELQPDGSFRIPDTQVDFLRNFIDTYHVNAFVVPRPTEIVSDPIAERGKLNAWLKSWDDAAERLNRPDVLFYTYLRDEPNTEEQYRFVQTWGPLIREAGSVVKVMVVEQTWTAPGASGQDSAWGNLYGAVDIWCPLFSLFREESAKKRQELGETIWTYTALCQREPTPWWETDFPLLNYRVPAWISWRYKIRGLLYWGGMSYWSGVDDPWTDPETLDRRDRSTPQLYNGDGMLVYPGRAAGYDGIAPSMRLKALRDAIEDYEYLSILERMGRTNEALDIIMPLAGSWNHWEKDPTQYQTAREKLAELIMRH